MRKREVIKVIRKMKEKIKEGKVVKDPDHLFEDDSEKSLYSLKVTSYDIDNIPTTRVATCGCLIGLWHLAMKKEDDYESFVKFITPSIPKKYFGFEKDLEMSIGATNVTKAGPQAMLRVLNTALKKLEA